MLKIHFDAYAKPHPICEVEATGSLNILLSDLSFIIGYMYSSLKRHDAPEAERFKELLQLGMTDERSPVFRDMSADLFPCEIISLLIPKEETK